MPNLRAIPALLLAAAGAYAHPMGNFSVSHYSRLELQPNGVSITYILDLAEIPTLELFQQWGVAAADSRTLQEDAQKQAPIWLVNLRISVGAQPVTPALQDVKAILSDGAGGMSVLRVLMHAQLHVLPGDLSFEDGNYANRTGWKEIVIKSSPEVSLQQASNSDRDLSHELTVYPPDLTLTPPQDLQAIVRWTAIAPLSRLRRQPSKPALPAVIPPLRQAVISPVHTFAERQPSAPGSIRRGDFLSNMLREQRFGPGAIVLGILAAFGLGAIHAFSPGHGKTIVAAYLVGSRGTLRHAMFLGFMVTFTHTISVFLLGLGVLFFQKYVVPDQIIPVLGAISGLSILCIGSWLLYKRTNALVVSRAHPHQHTHDHPHSHDHPHHHRHEEHVHENAFVHTHTHGGHTHSHVVPEGKVGLGSLVALGASGGLVPCPSALILLLSAIALGHTALGLALLVGFSAGLALVLMGIGAMVLYAKNLLPKTESAGRHAVFQLVPVFSSVVVIVLGLLMTLTAVGWIQPMRLLS